VLRLINSELCSLEQRSGRRNCGAISRCCSQASQEKEAPNDEALDHGESRAVGCSA